MKGERTYVFPVLLLLIGLFVFSPATSNARQAAPFSGNLGISWTPPLSPNRITEQLSFYEGIGVEYIEIKHPVSQTVLDSLSAYPFQVLIRSNREFLTTYVVTQSRDELLTSYSGLISQYSNYTFITGFGLYSYSQSFDEVFATEFADIEDRLSQISDARFYEVTSGAFNALDFSLVHISNDRIPENAGGYLLSKTYTRNDIELLERIFSEYPSLLFISSDWLDAAIRDFPELETALIELGALGTFVVPLPQNEQSRLYFNWAVFVLLLIWVSFGIHAKSVATYSSRILRFFTSHRFFVDDVMRYRERTIASGFFLFVQHALFAGLTLYTISALLISETGLTAFYHYFPQLALFGQNYFSLFIAGTLTALIIQIIALLWLYIPSSSMKHFSQVLTLFTWPFHADFVLVSLMLTLLLSGANPDIIIFLVMLFLLNWLLAFGFCSADSARYAQKKRGQYLFLTIGLHSIVNILIIVLVVSSGAMLDFLELITTL